MLFARRSTWTLLGTLLTGSHSLLSDSFIDHPVRRLIRECCMITFLVYLESQAIALWIARGWASIWMRAEGRCSAIAITFLDYSGTSRSTEVPTWDDVLARRFEMPLEHGICGLPNLRGSLRPRITTCELVGVDIPLHNDSHRPTNAEFSMRCREVRS